MFLKSLVAPSLEVTPLGFLVGRHGNMPSGTRCSGVPFSRIGWQSTSARGAFRKISNRVGNSIYAWRGYVQPELSATVISFPWLPDARWLHVTILFRAEHPAQPSGSIVVTVRHFWTGITAKLATSALDSNWADSSKGSVPNLPPDPLTALAVGGPNT